MVLGLNDRRTAPVVGLIMSEFKISIDFNRSQRVVRFVNSVFAFF